MEKKEIQAFIEETFAWLHAHPELSYEEHETTAKLKELLESSGICMLEVPLETGLVAEVGRARSPLVAIRADIDALPITEETGLPYASQNKGKMHACGHDFHTAAVLGAALLLKEREEELPGRTRILFQPAEEAPGGAKKVLAKGALGRSVND